jgi:hypothetical protein
MRSIWKKGPIEKLKKSRASSKFPKISKIHVMLFAIHPYVKQMKKVKCPKNIYQF